MIMKLKTGQKLKIKITINAEYDIDDLTEMTDIMENLEQALDNLRSFGSAEAEVDTIEVTKEAKGKQ